MIGALLAITAILLGTMILAEARPKLAVAVSILGIFAIFHGHAHGTDLPAGQSGLLYSMGFVIAIGCLHGLGIALGLVNGLLVGISAARCRHVYRGNG